MDNNKRINFTLKGIMGISFLRHPLQQCGYYQDSGYIFNTETAREAQNLYTYLSKFDNVVPIDSWNSRVNSPYNYEASIMLYQPKTREAVIWDYLHQKNFLPILIVSGVIPVFMRENYYIFPINTIDVDEHELISEFSNFEEFVIKNINFVVKALHVFRTDIFYNTSDVPSVLLPLYRILMAVGKIWGMYEREKQIDEQTSALHYREYRVCFTNLINGIKCLEDNYEIKTVIKKFVISFVESHFIDIINIAEINEQTLQKLKKKMVILHDFEFYYFPELLLKDICTPLLESTSFLQVKYQLHKEEILICNDTQQKNFTVKKMFYNNDTKEELRMRFLKFRKNVFETDEGLPLDMIVNTKPKVNIVKAFKPTGGTLACTSK